MGGFAKPAIMLGSSIAGHFVGKKAQKSAMQRTPEELAALTGATGAAGQLRQTGGELITSGRETLAGPRGYWQKLLGGNRAAMAQAVAGPRAALTDVYRGAERGLERSGVRGAQRDVATAELGRDRASRIAGLTTGVQPFAAQALTDIGGTELGYGAPMLGEAGGIFQNLLGMGAANRYYGRGQGKEASEKFGNLLFDMLSGIKWPQKRLPSRPPWGTQYPTSGPPTLPPGGTGPY